MLNKAYVIVNSGKRRKFYLAESKEWWSSIYDSDIYESNAEATYTIESLSLKSAKVKELFITVPFKDLPLGRIDVDGVSFDYERQVELKRVFIVDDVLQKLPRVTPRAYI